MTGFKQPAAVRPVRLWTTDPDEFSERISAGTPNAPSVRPMGTRFEVDARLSALPRMSLFSIRIDNARIIDRGPNDACGINIPLAEPMRFRSGQKTLVIPPGTASLRRPGEDFDETTPNRSFHIVVHLFGPLLTSLEEKLGRRPRFGETVSLETPEGEGFFRYLNFIWRETEHGAGFLRSPLATCEIENCLAGLFLAAAESEFREKPARATLERPTYLARAEEYVRANLTRPLSVLDIAAAAGVSARTLSGAFRRHRGVSTNGFVKQRRLEAVQRELLAAAPRSTKVTDVAIGYGFWHLGRFSKDYHRVFGETPSETLRR